MTVVTVETITLSDGRTLQVTNTTVASHTTDVTVTESNGATITETLTIPDSRTVTETVTVDNQTETITVTVPGQSLDRSLMSEQSWSMV